MLSVIILRVIILTVVAPERGTGTQEPNDERSGSNDKTSFYQNYDRGTLTTKRQLKTSLSLS
jgi:hypothetical protein